MLLLALPAVVATGQWFTSAGEGRVANAARDDFAAAIAAHLAAAPPSQRETITLTGPVAYSTSEVAQLVTGVTGRSVEVVTLDDAALTEHLKRIGIPEPFARTLASGDAHTRQGHAAATSNVLEKLARRAPRSLRDFLQANRAALLTPPSFFQNAVAIPT